MTTVKKTCLEKGLLHSGLPHWWSPPGHGPAAPFSLRTLPGGPGPPQGPLPAGRPRGRGVGVGLSLPAWGRPVSSPPPVRAEPAQGWPELPAGPASRILPSHSVASTWRLFVGITPYVRRAVWQHSSCQAPTFCSAFLASLQWGHKGGPAGWKVLFAKVHFPPFLPSKAGWD